MKGTVVTLNGDPWTVVDVAPAEPLAEMVAALLEDEGFVVTVRGADRLGDNLAHLGIGSAGTTMVLVPESEAEQALALIAETVTDYEGEALDEVLAALADDPEALGIGEDDGEDDGEDGEDDGAEAPDRD